MTKYKSERYEVGEGRREPPLLAPWMDGFSLSPPSPLRWCRKPIVRQVQRRVTNGNRRVELRSWWVYNWKLIGASPRFVFSARENDGGGIERSAWLDRSKTSSNGDELRTSGNGDDRPLRGQWGQFHRPEGNSLPLCRYINSTGQPCSSLSRVLVRLTEPPIPFSSARGDEFFKLIAVTRRSSS